MDDKNNSNQSNVINTAVDVGKNVLIKKAIVSLAPTVLPIIGIILLVIILIALIVTIIVSIVGFNDNLAMGGYYSMRCPEVTVIFTDKSNGYEVTDTKTYPLEEYVAGVVSGEVGFLGSIELDKAFAIAARSFLLTNDDDCTIESSDRKQVFRELTSSSTDQLARQAAEETKGKVLLLDGSVYGTQYDAFACIGMDNNYYTISQANQKVPRDWIESRINSNKQPNWFVCNGKENLRNHHGNGMSQYGGLYLATELNYTYEEILKFYLGELGVSISSGSFISSVAGLEVKDTTNSKALTGISLQNFLANNGTSIEELNAFIDGNVASAGKGTREGVVTAGVSLVNFLYDNFNVRIPYYWGGNYQKYGVDPNFGNLVSQSCSKYGSCFSYDGFDCSGFVSWAIKNGGYNIDRKTTSGFDKAFSKYSCNIDDSSCIGQPGDLINSSGSHVILIVAVDQESDKYMVVESTGGYGLIMRERPIHQSTGANTKILLMDNFYNNQNNVDLNY